MSTGVPGEGRFDLAADVGGARATGMEPAAGRRVDRARQFAPGDEACPGTAQLRSRDRYRRQQADRIGVDRPGVELLGRGKLDDFAEVHHGDAVRDVAYHAQVMGHEDVGEAELVLKVAQQVDDLGPDRDVKSRDGLVEHDKLRVDGEGPRHADPLPLPAGELVGVPVGVLGVQPHLGEKVPHAVVDGAVTLPEAEPGADDLANAFARVERALRVLEDDLHPASVRAHGALAERRYVRTTVSIAVLGIVGSQEPRPRPPGARLPAVSWWLSRVLIIARRKCN